MSTKNDVKPLTLNKYIADCHPGRIMNPLDEAMDADKANE